MAATEVLALPGDGQIMPMGATRREQARNRIQKMQKEEKKAVDATIRAANNNYANKLEVWIKECVVPSLFDAMLSPTDMYQFWEIQPNSPLIFRDKIDVAFTTYAVLLNLITTKNEGSSFEPTDLFQKLEEGLIDARQVTERERALFAEQFNAWSRAVGALLWRHMRIADQWLWDLDKVSYDDVPKIESMLSGFNTDMLNFQSSQRQGPTRRLEPVVSFMGTMGVYMVDRSLSVTPTPDGMDKSLIVRGDVKNTTTKEADLDLSNSVAKLTDYFRTNAGFAAIQPLAIVNMLRNAYTRRPGTFNEAAQFDAVTKILTQKKFRYTDTVETMLNKLSDATGQESTDRPAVLAFINTFSGDTTKGQEPVDKKSTLQQYLDGITEGIADGTVEDLPV